VRYIIFAAFTDNKPFHMIKRLLLSFLLLFVATLGTYAQKFYLRAGAGYAFPHASQSDFAYGVNVSGMSYQATFGHAADIKKVSFSEGANASIALGYKIHPNIAVDLGISAVIAPKKYESTMGDSSANPQYYFINRYKISSRSSLFLMPAIVFMTDNKSLNFFSRLGIALPVGGQIIIEGETDNLYTGDLYYSRFELTSRFAVGIHGALGVKYSIAKKIGLFLEANGISMNRYAKELRRVEYKENGQDQLSTLTPSDLVTEYDFNYNYVSNYKPYSPSKERTFSLPYSNVGLSLGIIFTP
jgi:hypothetical protein